MAENVEEAEKTWERCVPADGMLGDFFRLPQLHSAHLEHPRDVLVWLPPDYAPPSNKRYPVLYMHDGNNLFDRRTSFGGSEWQVDENLQHLLAQKKIQAPIVVGIGNTAAREDEYTWTPRPEGEGTVGGLGPQYARFVVEELKPLIDASFRTRPERECTAVAGSSLGGLISFYFGLHYPHVFSRIGILSPSLWWNEGEPIRDAAQIGPNLLLWVDMGMNEGSQPQAAIERVKAFVHALENRGYVRGENLYYGLDVDAAHNEAAWAGRVDEMLEFFFPI